MRIILGTTIVGIIALMVFISAQTGFAQLGKQGLIGRMVALERVDEDACGEFEEPGRCGFEASRFAMNLLADHIEHFNCITISGKPRVSLSSNYKRFSAYDPGPVVTADANDLRCSIDPRSELILVDRSSIAHSCSKLGWKCDVVWIPDYDKTIAFIGRLKSSD